MAPKMSRGPQLTGQHARPTLQHPDKKRRASDLETGSPAATSSARRRITRACDQCNRLRTRCNGQKPCAHCITNRTDCEYARAHKKRGRIPKTSLDAQSQSTIRPPATGYTSSSQIGALDHQKTTVYTDQRLYRKSGPPQKGHEASSMGNLQVQIPPGFHSESVVIAPENERVTSTDMSTLNSESLNYAMTGAEPFLPDYAAFSAFGFPLGDDYSLAFMGKAPIIESPDWMSTNCSAMAGEPAPLLTMSEPLRYPVLLPLLPHIESVLPLSLACDLFEQYFQTSKITCQRPSNLSNPYVAVSLFRKCSMLHATNPRECTPALLASILWISAQHSDASFLTSQPDTRARTCQKLLELTIGMLKPLVHNITTGSAGEANLFNAPIDTGLGGLVFPYDSIKNPASSRIQLDNIVTYIHLATVVSASERKAASLRWWNAAWSLAREIRLSRELLTEFQGEENGTGISVRQRGQAPASSVPEFSVGKQTGTMNGRHERFFSEEDREERRRVWWLLYICDRHLALCYNRPMFFLNQECESLLQPVDDEIWQSDAFERFALVNRRRGFDIRCTSHSLFGCFLPLMVILGEILDLNYKRNRPRPGSLPATYRDWSDDTDEILHYLKDFEQSVSEFESEGPCRPESCAIGTPSDSHHRSNGDLEDGGVAAATTNTTASSKPNDSEMQLHTAMVVAYARHIMHVLHILLTGKWDPIALLDDNDFWISSQSFVIATGHAVSAANELADIIEYDPDLSFMPYFFGIYLLQGSFLLLLFADKLKETITKEVVKACETIVRAHEACVATLDTQYQYVQRNFRKVMRSALQQLRGRVREDPMAQQNWRRDILKLYRWTGDGTGLAL